MNKKSLSCLSATPQLLIVKTSSLGDLVHTLPAVSDILQHRPGILLDWLAEEAVTDIPALHPGIRRVIPVALRRWRKKPFDPDTWSEIFKWRAKLRTVEYDWVIDYQGLLKSAVLSSCAWGTSWGLDFQSAREPAAAGFYHHRCAVSREQHAVERNRALAAQTLDYALPPSPPNYGISQSFLGVRVIPRRVVCLHATSRPGKNWPPEYWITLGKSLASQGCNCLFPWGNPQEQQAAASLGAAIPNAQVLPRMGLRELAAILSSAEWVIGMDTGLTHLAVALGRPTVALYLDTDPAKTGTLAGGGGWAINLGGPGKIPTPQEVNALVNLNIFPKI